MIIVSACLAGFDTRYDGTNCLDNKVAALVSSGKAIPVCPEQLGGLSTPREPIELCRHYNNSTNTVDVYALGADGKDYTAELIKGAEETLNIAIKSGVKKAIFKDGSPSCGVTYIWCSGKKTTGKPRTTGLWDTTWGIPLWHPWLSVVRGKGITTELLEKNYIEVITVDSI